MTLPSAAQARRKTEAAEAREAKRQAKQMELDKQKRADDRERILRVEVPRRLTEVEKKIKDAIAHGATHIGGFGVNSFTEGDGVATALRKKGYNVSQTYVESGTENMGDFNAPCNVDYTRYWIDISWER